jgi:preprotein translocase subunit SecA
VLAAVRRDAQQAYQNREAQVGEQIMRELERDALLSATDIAWREHLAAMSDLFSSAMIRAAGGNPSLPDYQREAAALYAGMTDRNDRSNQAYGCQSDLLRRDQAAACGQLTSIPYRSLLALAAN